MNALSLAVEDIDPPYFDVYRGPRLRNGSDLIVVNVLTSDMDCMQGDELPYSVELERGNGYNRLYFQDPPCEESITFDELRDLGWVLPGDRRVDHDAMVANLPCGPTSGYSIPAPPAREEDEPAGPSVYDPAHAYKYTVERGVFVLRFQNRLDWTRFRNAAGLPDSLTFTDEEHRFSVVLKHRAGLPVEILDFGPGGAIHGRPVDLIRYLYIGGLALIPNQEKFIVSCAEPAECPEQVAAWLRGETPERAPANENDTPETEGDSWGVIDWNKADPPVAWLVDKIIQEGTVSVAFGLPNSLKTWTCYLFAAAVASGRPWLGRPTRQGLVVIVDYESSERQARRRMRLLQAMGIDPRQLRYINPKEQLGETKLWDRIAKLKPALVIVDSLARGMLGVEENGTDMQIPFDNAKRLARACGASTVFVHHKNKSGKEGQAGVRGSSAIYAAAEGALEFLDFDRVNADVQRARLHCDRLKESTAFEDIQLELSNARGLTEVASAEPVQREELTVDGVKPRILLHACNNPGVGQDPLLRLAGLNGTAGRKIGAQALKELVADGSLNKIPRGTGHVYAPPASHALQEAAVASAMLAGITGQGDILAAAPAADLNTLVRMAGKKLIYKTSGNSWLKVAE